MFQASVAAFLEIGQERMSASRPLSEKTALILVTWRLRQFPSAVSFPLKSVVQGREGIPTSLVSKMREMSRHLQNESEWSERILKWPEDLYNTL